MNDYALVAIFLASSMASVRLHKYNAFPSVEGSMKSTASLAFVALAQAFFGGKSYELPERLQSLFKSPAARFIGLFALVFNVMRDIESTVFMVIAIATALQLIRTEEERKEYKYII